MNELVIIVALTLMFFIGYLVYDNKEYRTHFLIVVMTILSGLFLVGILLELGFLRY